MSETMTRIDSAPWLFLSAFLWLWAGTSWALEPSPQPSPLDARRSQQEELAKTLMTQAAELHGKCEGHGYDDVCAAYCSDDPVINVCGLRDDLDLARVAVAVDPVTAEGLSRFIEEFEPADPVPPPDVIHKSILVSPGDEYEIQSAAPALGGLGTGAILGTGGSLAALTTAEGVTELAIRFATALGELAVDRAKQEAVLWAVDQLGRTLCRSEQGADGPQTLLAHELSTYWLPQLCTLTAEENLESGFGAGQALLGALVSAVENDGKGLPGAAAGLLFGLAYWAEDGASIDESANETPSVETLLHCANATQGSSRGDACQRARTLRLATAEAIDGLLDGAEPVEQARTWSATIDEVNRVEDSSGVYALGAPASQLAACGLAVAAELGADEARRVLLAPASDAPVPDLYRVVAALTSAPACWTLVGQGAQHHPCNDDDTKLCLLGVHLARDRRGGQDIERISTVIRLVQRLRATQGRAGDAWRTLNRVGRRLQSARDRLSRSVEASEAGTLTGALQGLTVESLEPTEFRALADTAAVERAKARLSAALDVADEVIAAADATALLLEDLSDLRDLPTLLPGLLDASGQLPADFRGLTEVHQRVVAFRLRAEQARVLIESMREILAEDWAAAATKALAIAKSLVAEIELDLPRVDKKAELGARADNALLGPEHRRLERRRRRTERAMLRAPAHRVRRKIRLQTRIQRIDTTIANRFQSSKPMTEPSCQPSQTGCGLAKTKFRRRKRAQTRYALLAKATSPGPTFVTTLGQALGLFTAILSAEDSENIAVVLEKTASPPGGWRRKQVAGAFTVTLGAQVGAYTALEIRHGQYGVFYERGSAHYQAPTLSVPFGFDLAWGVRHNNSLGLFIPAIDPAAFLQYDVEEGGRLPGPRPITILSPGLLFRWGIFRSPFTVVAGYFYRPKLRTWEATVQEPGADAHQLGLGIAVDATLWHIVRR